MSDCWRNGAKTALGAGDCGGRSPRASRCGEHTQTLTACTCSYLCRSGDRSGSGSRWPQAAAARVTAGMIATRESTSDGSNVVSGDGGVSTGAGFWRQRVWRSCRPTPDTATRWWRPDVRWRQAGRATDRPQTAQPPGAVRAAKCRAAGGRLPRPRSDLHGDCQEVRGSTEHSRQVHPAGQASEGRGSRVSPDRQL